MRETNPLARGERISLLYVILSRSEAEAKNLVLRCPLCHSSAHACDPHEAIMTRRRGLGKGLDALIPSDEAARPTGVQEAPRASRARKSPPRRWASSLNRSASTASSSP